MKLSLYNKLSWWYIFFTCTIITQPQKYLHLICILTKLCMSQSVFHVSMYTFIHICSNEYSFHFSIAFCMNNFFWFLSWFFCFILFLFFGVFLCLFFFFVFCRVLGVFLALVKLHWETEKHIVTMALIWQITERAFIHVQKNTSLNRLKALFVPYKTVFYVAIWHTCRSK